MDGIPRRRCAVILAVIGIAVSGALPIPCAAAEVRHFAVPAGEAATTLIAFGLQAEWFVSYDFDRIQHHRTNAINGDFEVIEALRILLKSTGLGFRMVGPQSAFFDTEEPEGSNASPTVVPPASKGNTSSKLMKTILVMS